jgi:ABC-type histidine transport system ATPase subunit
MALLEVKDLHVEIDGREILKGLDLAVNAGEVHAIMPEPFDRLAQALLKAQEFFT